LIYALNMSGLNDSFHNGNKENRRNQNAHCPEGRGCQLRRPSRAFRRRSISSDMDVSRSENS
jgi:hypothetical protein